GAARGAGAEDDRRRRARRVRVRAEHRCALPRARQRGTAAAFGIDHPRDPRGDAGPPARRHRRVSPRPPVPRRRTHLKASSKKQEAGALASPVMWPAIASYLVRTLAVIDSITPDAILNCAPRSLMRCRCAIQLKSV